VDRRVALEIKPNPHNVDYLRTKRRRSQHMLDLFGDKDA
jgi:GTP cyclohydrolase II